MRLNSAVCWRMTRSAISAASSFGNWYAPVEIAGKAIDRIEPASSARWNALSYVRRRVSGSPRAPPIHTGPTAWMTKRASSRKPGVITASPGSQ
jgi:hypothetical protein